METVVEVIKALNWECVVLIGMIIFGVPIFGLLNNCGECIGSLSRCIDRIETVEIGNIKFSTINSKVIVSGEVKIASPAKLYTTTIYE